MEESSTQLWWAGKELVSGKKLRDYIGKNEPTKIVAKLQKKGQGPPAREPVFTEDDKKKMMAYAYRKQEELKVLSIDFFLGRQPIAPKCCLLPKIYLTTFQISPPLFCPHVPHVILIT